MAISSMDRGVNSETRAKIGLRHLRVDKWWVQPAISVFVLVSFIIYSTIRAFENKYYFAEPLISPFYSPCLATNCVEGASLLGQPIGSWWFFSPALLILIFPLGFRMTCYYYRKTYYRAFWLSPPACAVAEPHQSYSGETKSPLILQNAHRYFFLAGLVFNVLLSIDAILAFKDAEGHWGHLSVGTLVLLSNATFLWLYSLSCHSCRHILGGRLKHFSKHPLRYKTWTIISKLNAHHPKFAWISLIGVALCDFYVRLVASGSIPNFYFF